MRRYTLLALSLMSCLASWAITVNCQPGQLSSKVANPGSETILTITGSIDARDLSFIAENMRQLTYLNLQPCNIAGYDSSKELFGSLRHFAENEIPTGAFIGMESVTTICLPSTVTRIGESAMAGCSSMHTVYLPADLVTLGDYALADCPMLRNVKLPKNLALIGKGAFLRCIRLHTVGYDAPETAPALTIGDQAFAGCSALANINLGNSITSIGNDAFASTIIASTPLPTQTQLTSIGDFAFYGTRIAAIALPNSLTQIGCGAFLYNTALTSISLPSGIATIPAYLLAGNTSLTNLNIAATHADSIGERAFYMLNRVESLEIPATVAYIGTEAMAGNTGLRNLTVKAIDVPELGENVWLGVNQPSVTLFVPNGTADAYAAAEQWREFTIGDNFLLGDANDDGKIDVGDLNAIINYLLGKNPSPFNLAAADITGDGKIDVGDLNGEINLILNRSMTAPVYVTPNTGDVITIDNFSILPGEQRTVEVRLDNSVDYAALQCAITLPEGLSLVEGSVAGTARTATHQIALSADDNQLRLLAYSLRADEVTGDAGDAVLRFSVTADDRLPEQSTISITQVAMAHNDGNTAYASETQALVSRATTDIEQPSANDIRVYVASGTLFIEVDTPAEAQLITVNGIATPLQLSSGLNAYANLASGIYIVRIGSRSFKVAVK